MAEFDLPAIDIPANPTNADLAKAIAMSYNAVKKTHDCLEDHRSNTTKRDLVFSSQLKSTNDQITKVLAVVEIGSKDIAATSRAVRSLDKKVRLVTHDQQETDKIVKAMVKGFTDIRSFFLKYGGVALAALIGAIIVAVVQLNFAQYTAHQSTVAAITAHK